MQVDQRPFGGLYQSTGYTGCGPYEASLASSASSSQVSIFSDQPSTQSSVASSISDDFRSSQEDARDRAYAQQQLQQKLALEERHRALLPGKNNGFFLNQGPPQPSYADVTSLPLQQRQHPRRCSLSRGQRPPTLQRQCERKISFVENLVDSATQMVEVIWPLSVTPCRSAGGTERAVLPLRSYIEETLRRSKTSYSTLQVALYYLVLIKPFVPQSDFTQAPRMDCPASRALMCGRRMFLAALILASKYLQDRNYSAKAWSRMSGLKVCEINFNERTFLSKVSWKLHIPEHIFRRWTEIVLEYTPHHQPPPPGQSLSVVSSMWKAIIPLLTPELDAAPFTELKHERSIPCLGNYGTASPTTPTPTKTTSTMTQLESMSQESTPTPTTVLPRYLEPKFEMEPPALPPALPRMALLPTPQLTPSTVATNTPAVSTCGFTSRRPSICSAMAFAQQQGMNRCTMDAFPCKDNIHPLSRRPSITSTASFSSPESYLSDRTRSSRASSISSISTMSSTSSSAPAAKFCLARQATCRSARLPCPPVGLNPVEEKEGSATKPILINDNGSSDVEIVSSPDMADFSISEKVLSRPDKHTKHRPLPVAAASSTEKSRKRGRGARGNRRSHLQEEVRYMLEEAEADDLIDIVPSRSNSDEYGDVYDVEEDHDNGVNLPFRLAKPSPAAEYATRMLIPSQLHAQSGRRRSRSDSVGGRNEEIKAAQPPASLSRQGSWRRPVQGGKGGKRACCTASASHARGADSDDERPAGMERSLSFEGELMLERLRG